jgi:hypothetical protein
MRVRMKEVFTVKLKIISIDHYYCPHQTPKNTKNILFRNKQNISDAIESILMTILLLCYKPECQDNLDNFLERIWTSFKH